MRTGGTDGLILEVDAGRRAKGLFELTCPDEGARPPESISIENFGRDINPALCAHLLLDQFLREDLCKGGGVDDLTGSGIQRGRELAGQVGSDIVPGLRNLIV